MAAGAAESGISSWKDVVRFLKNQLPTLFRTGKFNFITIHYLYMIGMSILFSVIIYGIGGMDYIDALFFASGSCTQSGLNTIDVNTIRTGQQVCFYIAAMFCNPIVVHGSLVFVRLYWFEKRFEDVVKEARAMRRTRSRSRTLTFTKDEDVEQGRTQQQNQSAKGKAIHLLRQTGRKFKGNDAKGQPVVVNNEKNSLESSEESPRPSPPLNHEVSRRNTNESIDAVRLPAQMNTEQHITFLERQRNPDDTTALRIPSPREFDRGGRPETIDHVLDEDLAKVITRDSQEPEQSGIDQEEDGMGTATPPMRNHLTFNEPEIHRERSRTRNIPRAKPKRTRTNNSDKSGSSRQPRAFTLGKRTFTMGSRTGTIEPMPYLSYEPTVARNSFFVNLTEEQREELGGIEYRALKTLALVLICYFIGFHLFGIVCLLPWIMRDKYFGQIPINDGQGRVWWAIFTAQSAFNDLGFTLTPDSMISFQTATFPLLVMSFLIVIGNTGFPCMLRFTIWLTSQFTTPGSSLWEELQFLLDHPRRCFTLLFPRAATWWLFFILVLLNGLDLFFFVILDLNDETVTVLSGWFKFLDGLFQAFSTRTAGFSVVNLATLHPAIQVSYLVMMYISVFPIAISMRRTNVYEEKSLGVYAQPGEDDDATNEPSYVGAHLRKQLSFDLWYVFLGLFIIAIIEGDRLENTNQYAFTLFSVLFEIVSAYGTVGLSLGYPTINASFSAEFKTLSKLVIIAMQIRGRHRGLPYELDRAVLLPSETLHQKEQQEAQRIVSRRASRAMSWSAVEGQIDSNRFRPETGITSSFDPNHAQSPRERRGSNRTHNTTASAAESNHSIGARHHLGNVMFKVCNPGEAIKEEGSSIKS